MACSLEPVSPAVAELSGFADASGGVAEPGKPSEGEPSEGELSEGKLGAADSAGADGVAGNSGSSKVLAGPLGAELSAEGLSSGRAGKVDSGEPNDGKLGAVSDSKVGGSVLSEGAFEAGSDGASSDGTEGDAVAGDAEAGDGLGASLGEPRERLFSLCP